MIPHFVPWVDLSDSEVYFIQQALKDERLLNFNRQPRAVQVELLEQTWNGLIYRPSVAVSSCEDALFLALMGLGIESSNGVIIPNLGCFSPIEPIKRTGATPVLADVDCNGNLDIESLRDVWWDHSNIKAMVLVHMHGCPSSIEKLSAFCTRHEIPLIEDCRYSMGATYKKKPVGSFGTAACWSFSERPLIAGSGGMLSGDPWLIDLTRRFIQHDTDKETETVYRGKNSYSINHLLQYKPGVDFRMSGVSATVVRGFLMYRVERYLYEANRRGKHLIERLTDLPGVTVPTYNEGHSYHHFKIEVDPGLQSVLTTALAREGVPVMVWGFHPREEDYPQATKIYQSHILLFNDMYPLSNQSIEAIDWVADTVIKVFKEVKSYGR